MQARHQIQSGLLALCILLLIIRAAIPAFARSPGEESTQTVVKFPIAPSGTMVLWDQLGNPSGFKTNSQNYESANDAFDDELADDFFVPAGQTWTIQQVNVEGGYFSGNTGPASSVNVVFYFNDSTLPGAVVPGGNFQNVSMTDTAGNFSIALPSSVILTTGTYWVSVQANMNSVTNGTWGWNDRFLTLGAGAAWRNPAGGFMTACTPSWGRRQMCVPNPSGADQVFQILGTSVGGTPTPTPGPSGTPTPTATPVGNDKIIYNRVADDNFEIFVMDTNGANQTNLTNDLADDVYPAWSPDGTKIVFSSTRQDDDLEIYVMNGDGSNPVRITTSPGEDSSPVWSPDGQKIAFTSERDGNLEIYVMNADGSTPVRLTNNSVDDLSPAWSPDGTKIAFVTNRVGNYEIYSMDPDGGNQTNLTNNFADDFSPAWSPDGTRIAFESFRDNNFEIYRMNSNGTNPVRLTNNPAEDLYATWSPDGTKIAFTTNRNGNYDIYVMGADGSNQIHLTIDPAPEIDADWQRLPAGPTPTPSATPTATATATASSSVPPTPTATPTGTASGTPSATPTGTPASTPTPTSTPVQSPAKALNISTRLRVQTGDNVLIGGFIITGTTPKSVAVRGIGPSLGAFGVPDPLADPTLELRASNGTIIMQNDNWQDDPGQAAQLSALGLGLTDPNEAGLVTSLQPNAYTAIVAGKNNTTGVGLVEIYDTAAGADSQLANISTRGFVLTDTNVMIGGFILGGGGDARVVVRGIGPSLSQFLNPVLEDPTLELHDNNGATLVANDNWQDDPDSAAQLILHGLAPQDPNESGIYQSLPAGTFTAILAGKNGGTGIGLVEVYNVP